MCQAFLYLIQKTVSDCRKNLFSAFFVLFSWRKNPQPHKQTRQTNKCNKTFRISWSIYLLTQNTHMNCFLGEKFKYGKRRRNRSAYLGKTKALIRHPTKCKGGTPIGWCSIDNDERLYKPALTVLLYELITWITFHSGQVTWIAQR